MLDKKAKRVLDITIQLERENRANPYIKLSDILPKLGHREEILEYQEILKYLYDFGYIKKYEEGTFGNETEIELTHKGRNYKSFRNLKFKEKIIWNILVPIVLAIITAIVVSLIVN